MTYLENEGPSVLVTGANGFVGSALCRHLAGSGLTVRAAVRDANRIKGKNLDGCETVSVGEIHEATDWSRAVAGVNVVIHAAARVHVMHERAADPVAEFKRVNTVGTERLASEAIRNGVRRLVYVSSIKVNGETTGDSGAFCESDAPCPSEPYGQSKFLAEESLFDFSARSGLEVVVVRPTLVYGPQVRGNFGTMLTLAHRGIPLPLGAITNARSLVSLDNLSHFLSLCATHPAAVGETFLISDERPVSTPELLRLLAAGMGKASKLFPVPERLIEAACKICGLGNIHRRLCQSLVVDTGKAKSVLGWKAPVAVEDALRRTGSWYAEATRKGVRAT